MAISAKSVQTCLNDGLSDLRTILHLIVLNGATPSDEWEDDVMRTLLRKASVCEYDDSFAIDIISAFRAIFFAQFKHEQEKPQD